MKKEDLIKKIKEKGPTHSKDTLISWIIQLEPESEKTIDKPDEIHSKGRKPIKNKIGDVYMHGAFKHPYVLLEKKEGFWLCGLLTTEPACNEILEPCRSRFFPSSFITRTLFTVTEQRGSFLNTYDNTPHLKKVILKLKSICA